MPGAASSVLAAGDESAATSCEPLTGLGKFVMGGSLARPSVAEVSVSTRVMAARVAPIETAEAVGMPGDRSPHDGEEIELRPMGLCGPCTSDATETAPPWVGGAARNW